MVVRLVHGPGIGPPADGLVNETSQEPGIGVGAFDERPGRGHREERMREEVQILHRSDGEFAAPDRTVLALGAG